MKKMKFTGSKVEADAVRAARDLCSKEGRMAMVVLVEAKAVNGGVEVDYCVHAEGCEPVPEYIKLVMQVMSDNTIAFCKKTISPNKNV